MYLWFVILKFHKYHGTGNDFILIDNRSGQFTIPQGSLRLLIEKLCNRHFGIGADGLILLENAPDHDFRMVYFNSDGNEGSFCGNGSRCIVAFAHQINAIKSNSVKFAAVDGIHHAEVIKSHNGNFDVMVDLNDTDYPVNLSENTFFIDTGSPHLVIIHENIASLDVTELGRRIRHSPKWAEKGVNVNFAQIINRDTIAVRTYERGVEQETLSCGTGVTAVALTCNILAGHKQQDAITVQTEGGSLLVSFISESNKKFRNIRLRGAAELVFSGNIKI